MSRGKKDSSLAWKAGRLVGLVNLSLRRPWHAISSSAHRSPSKQDPMLARWYANLEIPYGSDMAEVKRARKRLLARYHPDRHASDPETTRKAGELTLAIQHAYEQLAARLEAES